MNFYTSDTHFYHESLLNSPVFSPRSQFLTSEEMNEKIIESWNNKVKQTDTVYHLGDISLAFTKPSHLIMTKTLEILNRLNGNLVIIKGNHDNMSLLKFLMANNYATVNGELKFTIHEVGTRIKFNHYEVFLTHYPLMFGITKNKINLHGHIHNYSVHQKENINVGIDSPEIDYLPSGSVSFGAPLSESEIIHIIQAKRTDYLQRV
ncbi:metallophosphatase [Leuconostoc carnosum]|uniref:metallophosphoesterase family protein n=1 Tax=Leuconostoc carnosum TaxID=1252 RepID=UPI00123BA434|nr:metallophosphoesterase family protein [Leuconostoc carnosum]KAA8370757.1 metallophosphatase [Leuconostoc carnosum]KAA8381332.1 metallophosphatase [Leuconostoc carnosum]KAA8382401.1 metallophosphatase [Leuconostoc carnosum]